MRSFTVNAVGPFSLRAAIGFLNTFDAAGFAEAPDHQLDLAFAADRDWHPVGVQLQQRGTALNGVFWGEGEAEHVRSQVQRILSLDVDATGFVDVGRADPVVGDLQARFPGLRPVRFWSPYEAACWAVIGQQDDDPINAAQASALKARIAREIGPLIEVGSRQLAAFPPPAVLADPSAGSGRRLDQVPGVPDRTIERLRAIAGHALDGDLDAFLLRDLPPAEALAHLHGMGIGGFGAELVLIRGVGGPDLLPTHEPGLSAAVARAYDLPGLPTTLELERIAERWRPFRSWVWFLLRRSLDT